MVIGCRGLKNILVDNGDEVERIKALLLASLKSKVVIKSVFEHAEKLQLNYLKTLTLQHNINKHCNVLDGISFFDGPIGSINQFLGSDSCYYRAGQEEMSKVPLLNSKVGWIIYESALNVIINQQKSANISRTKAESKSKKTRSLAAALIISGRGSSSRAGAIYHKNADNTYHDIGMKPS